MFQVERAYCTLVNAASLTLSKNTRETILNIGDPSSYGCDSSIPHQLILEADVFLFAKKSIWSLEDRCCFPGVYSSMKIQHGLVSKLLDYQDLCVFAALSKTIESHNAVKNHSTKWAIILLRCNETILELCYQVLHRWMLDLDPSHLDEATIPTKTWAATCFWWKLQ